MSNKNVLLIEDDVIVQKVHKSMLNKLGCNVDLAVDGRSAVEMATSESSYEIIFVDIGLPDISGFEVINLIRAQNKKMNRETPIIAVTGYCGSVETKACMEAGVQDVLSKPVVINTMREVLNKYT